VVLIGDVSTKGDSLDVNTLNIGKRINEKPICVLKISYTHDIVPINTCVIPEYMVLILIITIIKHIVIKIMNASLNGTIE
jgi:hypothetical protein